MINDDNISLGFRDLLFNSGVACLLLFILFSVKIGFRVIDSNSDSKKTETGNYKFLEKQSLIIEDKKRKGDHISIILFELQPINKVEYKSLYSRRNEWLDPIDVKDNDLYFSHHDEHMIVYSIINKLRNVEIGFDVGDPSFINFGVKSLRAKLLDGMRDIENGQNVFISDSKVINLSNKTRVRFQPTSFQDEPNFHKNLFEIQ